MSINARTAAGFGITQRCLYGVCDANPIMLRQSG